jgi:hypothetical protein
MGAHRCSTSNYFSLSGNVLVSSSTGRYDQNDPHGPFSCDINIIAYYLKLIKQSRRELDQPVRYNLTAASIPMRRTFVRMVPARHGQFLPQPRIARIPRTLAHRFGSVELQLSFASALSRRAFAQHHRRRAHRTCAAPTSR